MLPGFKQLAYTQVHTLQNQLAEKRAVVSESG
jgi:hypothetical protein